jgi:membrane protein DedA with SNARE-associated domain
MGSLLDNLGALVVHYPAWSHWIIAVAILIQGETVVLVSTFLIANGNLSWYGFLVPAILSIVVADVFLFLLGRVLRNTRFGWRFYRKIKHKKRTQLYLFYVKENVNKLMIISKFLIGANILAVFAVSWSKVKFGKFLQSQLVSLFLWFIPATAIAYFFASGFSYLKSEKIFRQMEIGIFVVMILIFLGEHFLRKMITKSFNIQNKAKEIGKFVEDRIEENKETEEKKEL